MIHALLQTTPNYSKLLLNFTVKFKSFPRQRSALTGHRVGFVPHHVAEIQLLLPEERLQLVAAGAGRQSDDHSLAL